ncbi:hypothetical protein Tco_0516040 [Tanacetum coccineum]
MSWNVQGFNVDEISRESMCLDGALCLDTALTHHRVRGRKGIGLGKGRVIIQQDFDNLEAELQKARAQITKLIRKQLGNNSKISLAHFKIANLEQIIEDI